MIFSITCSISDKYHDNRHGSLLSQIQKQLVPSETNKCKTQNLLHFSFTQRLNTQDVARHFVAAQYPLQQLSKTVPPSGLLHSQVAIQRQPHYPPF